MSSPLFNAIGGGMPQNNGPMQMMQEFKRFRREMQGKNPQEEINRLLQSGKISQGQLDKLQQIRQQYQDFFKGFFN